MIILTIVRHGESTGKFPIPTGFWQIGDLAMYHKRSTSADGSLHQRQPQGSLGRLIRCSLVKPWSVNAGLWLSYEEGETDGGGSTLGATRQG
jgi:hypothetical protein